MQVAACVLQLELHDGFVGVTITNIIMMLSVESTPLKEETHAL